MTRLKVLAVASLASCIATGLSAQTPVAVRGRVLDAGTNGGIQNASVTVEGRAPVLTAGNGAFLIQNVVPGRYRVQVDALGYATFESTLELAADTSLTLSLEPNPVELDEILVEAETLDFDGRIRDPDLEANIPQAQVESSQGHEGVTDIHGRFDFDDVYQRLPIRIVARAFGYLTLDTTFVPTDDERHAFDLVADPIMARMIEVQGSRLEERSQGFFYRPAVNREAMTRYMDNGTLQTVMEAKFPRQVLEQIGCFFLDERLINDREERTFVFQNTFAKELQRIEIFEFPGGPGRFFMIRAYTRGFYQSWVGRQEPLTRPAMGLGLCR